MASELEAKFRRAVDAFFANDLVQAEQILQQIAKASRNIFDVEHLLGLVKLQQGRYSDAEVHLRAAVALNGSSDEALSNYGYALKCLNRPQEALVCFTRALAVNPRNPFSYHNRGTILAEFSGNYSEAIEQFDKATFHNPSFADSHSSKGNCLGKLRRYEEALAAYDKALSIRPDLTEAWLGRGNVFTDLKRYDEAFSAYDKALSIMPGLAEAWVGRGNVFTDLKRHDEALAAYDKALSIRPDLAEAWLGRGHVFTDLKRHDEAIAAYDKALSIRPDLAEAWLGRGNVFNDVKRYDEAFAAYDKALSIKPDLEGIEGARLHAKMNLCNWDNLEEEISHLTGAIRAGKANSHPFALLSLTDLPDDHLRCARAWAAAKHPPSSETSSRSAIYKHDKIRVGYVSPDFRQHPVGYLTAEIFESHDTNRFETYAFSTGLNDNSDLRRRLERSFHCFVDCQQKSDSEALEAIKNAEIDILVDLAGYTQDARLSLFASGPAPIAVNFLGFAGTLGSKDLSNYIIADHIVVPDLSNAFFEEKIIRLPGSFMPRGRRDRTIDKTIPNRADHNLGQEWIVFCCFNNAYKINPSVFDCWLNVLRNVDQSVLWLSDIGEIAKSNLRKEAKKLGVDPDRLVFAKRLSSLSDHLARHRLADIFLDTLPYNAHATASDALWAGLPVVTQIGNSFAGRVAASLLDAVGLPELITRTRDEYEALAINLALDRPKLQGIRERLQNNLLTTSLFDAALYTKRLEAAYEAMYQRHQAGLPPDHIEIPPFTGLAAGSGRSATPDHLLER